MNYEYHIEAIEKLKQMGANLVQIQVTEIGIDITVQFPEEPEPAATIEPLPENDEDITSDDDLLFHST